MDGFYNACVNDLVIDGQIKAKQRFRPYYATERVAMAVHSDQDVFPFTRFWGPYGHVYDRPAGYHPVAPARPYCYKNNTTCLSSCFQYPASVVFPCNDINNPNCIVLYR